MDLTANAVSLADVCIRYGILLIQTCKSYRHADQEIRESILMIESRWLKIQRQMELLRNIWSSLDDEYQVHQNNVLHVFYMKAQAAISLVDGVIGISDELPSIRSLLAKRGEARRSKYAIMVKNSLRCVHNDLREWSEVFDVSWYLIIRQANQQIEQELTTVTVSTSEPLSALKSLRDAIKSNLTKTDEEIKATVFVAIDHFNGSRQKLVHSLSEVWCNADSSTQYFVDEASLHSGLSDLCKLANILRKVVPWEFGILPCAGVIKRTTSSAGMFGHSFMFTLPSNVTDLQNLRALRLANFDSYPLDDRFTVAKQMAKAVMFTHSAGFVHKNIRPETIFVMRSSNGESIQAFLTGFENFRQAEGRTLHQGDESWEKNLYRHPTRQGIRPEVDYCMQHDIYSLGVCLLELGLDSSLVIYDPRSSAPVPSSAIAEVVLSDVKDTTRKGFDLKRCLMKLARNEVRKNLGRRLSDIVLTCLTCLDKTENKFGYESELFDENGVYVGVRFIEEVLSALLELKI